MKRVAVIGSGIAGLAAAHALSTSPSARALVTLYEAGTYFGGHTHTVDVSLPAAGGPITHGVDTGFLVFNDRTYPELVRLFERLGVTTTASEMSFSVQTRNGRCEWSGANVNTVFAQRSNLLRADFWRMLADILRFNRLATKLVIEGCDARLAGTVAHFLAEQRFSAEFEEGYLLPMIGCIWSCPTRQMLRFPLGTLLHFCHNHGLLQVADRPQWRTVLGGARHYVAKMVAAVPDARLATPVRRVVRTASGARLATDTGSAHYDEVVFACHSDQALALLADATEYERSVLGAIGYRRNRAVLHTDTTLLPRRRRAWAAWNYERASSQDREESAVCLHYLMNRLQPLPFDQPVIVSLNPLREPQSECVLGEYDYEHPVFDLAAVAAQRRLPALQGRQHSWFCGAWTGYGFHEDGLASGLAVATAILAGSAADTRRAA